MTRPADRIVPALATPQVLSKMRPDGATVLASALELGDYPRCLGDLLVRNAAAWPDRVFLGERTSVPNGPWRTVTWSETLNRVRSLGQAILDLGATPERPLILLSGNSIAHALLTLAAMHVGVPAVPVSVAYSLLSRDFARLKAIVDRVTPSVVFVERVEPFARAIEAARLGALPLITRDAQPDLPGSAVTSFENLLDISATRQVDERFSRVDADTVAKVLFTSGSTDLPKGVVNTQRMLCSNQAALGLLWPFLAEQAAVGQPPVLCDWLPWNHTFGGNFNFNMIVFHGGTLWIDSGKPTPELFEASLVNLRELQPSLYFNVPRGFDLLIRALESDGGLRENFFQRLEVVFYAGAALPQNLWARLERVALETTGRCPLMVSGWGSTETAPCATVVHWPIDEAGVLGNPLPGTEIALVNNADKQELRVRGPNVTPGYWRDDDRTAGAFDEYGFYRIGDAGRLASPADPSRGLIFDGRVAEDFKLSSGTWVHVGRLRVEAIAACEPLVSDCVVAGHDRQEIGLLLFPDIAACRNLLRARGEADSEALLRADSVRETIRRGLATHNARHPGSSRRFARALLLDEPPSIDANEITDKGYINQGAVIRNRASALEKLFSDDPVVIRTK